jgi:GNAT superfamily N-acetyltransferase
MKLRAYRARRDLGAVYALWQRTLGKGWDLERAALHAVLGMRSWKQRNHHLVACDGARVIGFAGVQHGRLRYAGQASLLVVLVDPVYARRGVGTRLVACALERARACGVKRVALGRGFAGELWDGLPDDLAAVRGFFERAGFRFGGPMYAVTRACCDPVVAPPDPRDLCIRQPTLAEVPRLLHFQARHFREWFTTYVKFASLMGPRAFAVAYDRAGDIAGSFILIPCQPGTAALRWRELAGRRAGTVIGGTVRPDMRGRGIASQLLAYSMRSLADAGAEYMYVQRMIPFMAGTYERMGFRVWRSFVTARLELSS